LFRFYCVLIFSEAIGLKGSLVPMLLLISVYQFCMFIFASVKMGFRLISLYLEDGIERMETSQFQGLVFQFLSEKTFLVQWANGENYIYCWCLVYRNSPDLFWPLEGLSLSHLVAYSLCQPVSPAPHKLASSAPPHFSSFRSVLFSRTWGF
jgi:hypothetical protein